MTETVISIAVKLFAENVSELQKFDSIFRMFLQSKAETRTVESEKRK